MKEAGTVDEKQTPMKKQYDEIKKEVPDCLLFFRLGDFYELFDEDAIIASSALHLTLTTRDRNKPKDKQMPMCGVPYHAADSYIGRGCSPRATGSPSATSWRTPLRPRAL